MTRYAFEDNSERDPDAPLPGNGEPVQGFAVRVASFTLAPLGEPIGDHLRAGLEIPPTATHLFCALIVPFKVAPTVTGRDFNAYQHALTDGHTAQCAYLENSCRLLTKVGAAHAAAVHTIGFSAMRPGFVPVEKGHVWTIEELGTIVAGLLADLHPGFDPCHSMGKLDLRLVPGGRALQSICFDELPVMPAPPKGPDARAN